MPRDYFRTTPNQFMQNQPTNHTHNLLALIDYCFLTKLGRPLLCEGRRFLWKSASPQITTSQSISKKQHSSNKESISICSQHHKVRAQRKAASKRTLLRWLYKWIDAKRASKQLVNKWIYYRFCCDIHYISIWKRKKKKKKKKKKHILIAIERQWFKGEVSSAYNCLFYIWLEKGI
jgi:hypothetical protein